MAKDIGKKKVEILLPEVKHVLVTLGFSCIFFFLIANILSSQRFSTLYFSLIEEQKNAMITFLKRNKDSNAFVVLKPEVKELIGLYEEDIFREERQRKELILKLEQLLATNPPSKDMLYSLHLLYEASGDTEKAQQYLQQAQYIDPSVK